MADKYKGKTAKEWAELADTLDEENRGLITQLDERPGKFAEALDKALNDARYGRMAAMIPSDSEFIVGEISARREYRGDLMYGIHERAPLEVQPELKLEITLYVTPGRRRRGRK